jgi:hypothetical protein
LTARAKHVLSQTELAAMAGVSATTWKAHVAQGAPTPKSRADLPAWAKRYHAWRRQNGKVETEPRAVREDDPNAALRAEQIKIRTMRDKIALAREQGQLVPRQQVIDYASEAVLAANQQFDAMLRRAAARLGPLCQGGEAAVESVLAEEIDVVRERLADGMQRTHDPGRTWIRSEEQPHESHAPRAAGTSPAGAGHNSNDEERHDGTSRHAAPA